MQTALKDYSLYLVGREDVLLFYLASSSLAEDKVQDANVLAILKGVVLSYRPASFNNYV